MPELTPVLSPEAISRSVDTVAQQINADYRDRECILIGVLKGAFIFLADLMRRITIPVSVDFLRAASYGAGTSSSGRIQLLKDIEVDVTGKHVILVEDIVDTGWTLAFLMEHMRNHGAASVRICALIDKKERRAVDVHVDYVCTEIPDGFLVGYGLDYDEGYRGLPGIYQLNL